MIEVRVLTCKNRDEKPLLEWLKNHSIQARVFEDTTDNYLLPVGNPDRLKGAIMNYRKLLSDENVPEDNHDFIVMVEDDITPVESLEPTLRAILAEMPRKSVLFGMIMANSHSKDILEKWEKDGRPAIIAPNEIFTTQLTIVPKTFGRLVELEAKYQGGFIRYRKKIAPYDTMTHIVAETYGLKQMAVMPNLVEHDIGMKPILNQDRSNKARHSIMFDRDFDYKNIDWRKEFYDTN